MKIQNLIKTLHKPVHPIVTVSVVIVVVLLIAGYLFYPYIYIRPRPDRHNFSSYTPPKITYHTPSTTPTIKPTFTPQPTITLTTFTSNELGISFSYPSVSWNITPHVVGSKIFFRSDTGQFIQVFHLSQPASNIETAVKNTILEGYSDQDCSVLPEDVTKRGFAPNIEFAVITFPGNDGSDVPQAGEDKCPRGYVNKGGFFYFLMDKNHPSTLLFISESQQPLAGVGYPITTSIKVLY